MKQAILEAALGVFRDVGFERASMAMISRRLGGSKGTLYGYFKSKEELFEAAMKAASEGPGDQIMDLLNLEAKNVPLMLRRFAKAYLDFITGDEVLSITRTAIHEGASSELGAHLFDQGPGRAVSKMAQFFSAMMKAGRIRKAPPEQVARHFKALVEAGFLEEALFGAPVCADSAIKQAVEVFLRAYAPES